MDPIFWVESEMQFLTDYWWFAKIDKIKIQGFTNGCDATDQCTASCARIGKRTAERGGATSKRKAKAGLPQGMCAMHPVQTAASDLKCDYAGRKWLVCNNPSALSFYFEDSLTFWNATILCDCPRYIIYIHFLTALIMRTTSPQQNFPLEVDFLPGRYPVGQRKHTDCYNRGQAQSGCSASPRSCLMAGMGMVGVRVVQTEGCLIE